MSRKPDSLLPPPRARSVLVGPVAWLATWLVVCILCSPAQARTGTSRQTAINASLEGGYTEAHSLSKIGGHLALRASLVSVIGRNRLSWPEAWFGGYARFQHGLRGSRVAIGAGHSLRLPFIGLEGGLVVARDEGEDFGVGGELTMVVTAGFIALYVRESLIDRDSNRWQTDVGLRLNFPFFLGSN